MTTKTYNKLVRDKIPEIIKAEGHSLTYRKLGTDEFAAALKAKLDEEVSEFQQSSSIDELVDVLTVIDAIMQIFGHDKVLSAYAEKFTQRGNFSQGLFLMTVHEHEYVPPASVLTLGRQVADAAVVADLGTGEGED